MADPQDRPDEGAAAAPPAKKAAAKKAPAKKAAAKAVPAKKAPAKKAPAKKTPAKKTPAKKAPAPQPALSAATAAPALTPAPAHAALTAGTNGAKEAAAKAEVSVQEAVAPRPQQQSFGRGHTIPLSLGLAVAGLVAIVLSRFRRD